MTTSNNVFRIYRLYYSRIVMKALPWINLWNSSWVWIRMRRASQVLSQINISHSSHVTYCTLKRKHKIRVTRWLVPFKTVQWSPGVRWRNKVTRDNLQVIYYATWERVPVKLQLAWHSPLIPSHPLTLPINSIPLTVYPSIHPSIYPSIS